MSSIYELYIQFLTSLIKVTNVQDKNSKFRAYLSDLIDLKLYIDLKTGNSLYTKFSGEIMS